LEDIIAELEKACVRLRKVKRYVRRVQFWYKKLERLKPVGYHMDKGLKRAVDKVLRVRGY